MKETIEIYIHIPFCAQKCGYCDFLSFRTSDKSIKEYVDALLCEIKSEAPAYSNYHVISVFIGGGTPSFIDSKYICLIMETLRSHYDVDDNAEITIECNPGTVNEKKFIDYKNVRINRLSFGLQSANNDELIMLGRIHDFDCFRDNYKLARRCGFDNINIDIMLGLPGQSIKKIDNTINEVLKLEPNHISAYSLIIEEETKFHELYGENGPFEDKLISEEEDRKIYYLVREKLNKSGFLQYELSNFAEEGFECKHNIGYWIRTDYVGFGLGASSFIQETRWKNTEDFNEYCDFYNHSIKIIQNNKCAEDGFSLISEEDYLHVPVILGVKKDIEILSSEDQISETLFLGLRLTNGVDLNRFEESFGMKLENIEAFKAHTSKMIENDLVELSDKYLKLTNKGMDVANYVMSGYLFDYS